LSDAKLPIQGGPVDFGISVGEDLSKPVVNFAPTPEVVISPEYPDRIEWVRKSYERFIEKVLEIEALRGPAPAF
jgi:hypothetical protein